MTKINVCKQCPLRLFNNKGYNINGIGNVWSGNALILPDVDKSAYKKQDMSFSSQVDIIRQILPTGWLEDYLYVVPLIRCNEHFDIEISKTIISRCYHYFEEDASKYQLKNIMLCGDAARRILNISDLKTYLNTVICDNATRRRYFINYNPLVKYTNNDNFEVFKTYLFKYLNSIVSKMYDYEIVII